MTNDQIVELYKIYLSGLERHTDRRINQNRFFTILTSGALAALWGTQSIENYQEVAELAAILIAGLGITICVTWTILLVRYKKVSQTKFAVIYKMEKNLAFNPYMTEAAVANKSFSISNTELIIPIIIGFFFVFVITTTVLI